MCNIQCKFSILVRIIEYNTVYRIIRLSQMKVNQSQTSISHVFQYHYLGSDDWEMMMCPNKSQVQNDIQTMSHEEEDGWQLFLINKFIIVFSQKKANRITFTRFLGILSP